MSNLQPLKWTQRDLNPLAELELTAYSALHEYVITEPKQGKFELKKTRLSRPDKKSEFLPYFDTVTEAQDWAWSHYQRSMQPYVKPSPTWIDYKIKQPTEKGDYLIRDYQGRVALGKYGNGFYMESGGEKWGMVSHWMPIPEFKQGE